MSENIADVSMEEYLDQSDLSDKEDAQQLNLIPFHVDWLDLSGFGCPAPLGISDLPGCRFKDTWRSLAYDIEAGFVAHEFEIEDGQVPEMSKLMLLVEEIRISLMAGRRTLVHCHGDGGRSSVVAVSLLLVLDENLSLKDAVNMVKELRRKPAIPSVKQYNFMNGFKGALEEYVKESKCSENRSLSR